MRGGLGGDRFAPQRSELLFGRADVREDESAEPKLLADGSLEHVVAIGAASQVVERHLRSGFAPLDAQLLELGFGSADLRKGESPECALPTETVEGEGVMTESGTEKIEEIRRGGFAPLDAQLLELDLRREEVREREPSLPHLFAQRLQMQAVLGRAAIQGLEPPPRSGLATLDPKRSEFHLVRTEALEGEVPVLDPRMEKLQAPGVVLGAASQLPEHLPRFVTSTDHDNLLATGTEP